MSGIMCQLQAAGHAVPPLVTTVSLNGAPTTINVSGASGNLYTAIGGSGLVVSSISGGTGSYPTGTLSFVSEGNTGSASASMATAPGDTHQTIYWTSMAVGDFCVFHLHIDATDTAGTDAHADSVTYALHRTS